MAPRQVKVNPAFAWLFVFLPALCYFLSTRLSSGFWSELGEPTTSSLLLRLGGDSHTACTKLHDSFYMTTLACAPESSTAAASVELSYPLRLVQKGGLNGVVDMLWRHDSNLGRGYLLLSESAGKGRIWRWEVGGGPIAIGKTLHVDNSGCRSANFMDCSSENAGSGAMAIDFYHNGNPSKQPAEGLLVVSEWGEGRIVRLEDNGARTPLLVHVPCNAYGDKNEATCSKRISPAKHMMLTSTGDLLVSVNFDGAQDCHLNTSDAYQNAATVEPSAAIVQLPGAVHLKPLLNLQESREAHTWTASQHSTTSRVLYSDPSVSSIGGIAVTPISLYATAKKYIDGSSKIVILEMSIALDDDDDELGGLQDQSTAIEAKVLFDLAEYAPGQKIPGALVVSQSGRFFVAVQDGVLIIDRAIGVLGKLLVEQSPTAITLGEDGYLYVASASRLYRIRTKEKPVKIPTDQVARPPKSLKDSLS